MSVKTKPVSPEDAINPQKALVPVVHKTNEMRVKRDFWPKMRRVASRIPFANQALAAWYATQDPETPFRAKAVLLGALAYFVMPVDAVPDVLAVVGFSDDAAVIAAVLATFGANIKDKHHQKAKETLTRMREDETGD
ncbi:MULTISPECIES: YkvA family protein [unclassified Brevundimonas]|uniref:YkvA family protein n=1 Tax=unclassified Brevundimonas TaxID=2622653 RepID=UPI0025B8C1A6|nr:MULTISPECIES: YkvA family protein [unclassified Brevundimonas]